MLYVWSYYVNYYHSKQKQFMQFYIHNTIWTPLCTIIPFHPIMNAIIYYKYPKELNSHHWALLYALFALLVIVLVKRDNHIVERHPFTAVYFK